MKFPVCNCGDRFAEFEEAKPAEDREVGGEHWEEDQQHQGGVQRQAQGVWEEYLREGKVWRGEY